MFTKKKLHLTSLPIGLDTDDYYLSRNCLIYPRDERMKDKIVLKNSWMSTEEIKTFKESCMNTYDQVLEELIVFLNSYHNLEEDRVFWERILGKWLYIYVSNYLEKLERLTEAFKLNPNLIAQSITLQSFKIPSSTKQFIALLRTREELHLQQFSIILENHFPENVQLYDLNWFVQNDSENLPAGGSGGKSFKGKIVKVLKHIIPSGYKMGKSAIYVSLFSNLDLFKLLFKTKFKCFPIFNGDTIKYTSTSSVLKRKQLDIGVSDSTVNQHIISSLKYFIPVELLEGFKERYDVAQQNIKRHRPQNIVTGIGFSWNTEFAIWASLCGKRGTHIYGCQHGGAYGDVEMILYEYFERSDSDTFLTWGWDDGKDTKPFYSPVLSSKECKKDLISNDILWVTTGDSRFQYFIEQIVSGERYYSYFEDQHLLYQSLEKTVKNKIQVRLYPIDFGWKFKERWLDKFPQIRIAPPEESFLSQVEKSELIIIDHLGGTTALECLHLNKPFMIVANRCLFEIRDSAKDIHDQLNEVGVLHYTIASAANKLNEVHTDIANWWANGERQKVLQSFKVKYAATEQNKFSEWTKLLSN